MKTLTKFYLIAFCTCLPLIGQAQCGSLVWSDEFDDASLDLSKWSYQTGNGCPGLCGWGNAELQNYTNSTNNVRLQGGNLILEARNDGGNYTSGRITTQGMHSWQYGRFEMRARLPSGTGLWPAFWMLSDLNNWPMTGEIDIMENRGDQINHIGGTLHYGDPVPNNRNDGTGYTLPAGTFTDDFHVFAVEWEAGEIRWYVDGVLYKTETRTPNTLNPPSNNDPWPWDNSNFYIIVNLAIGGPGTPYTGFQNPNFGTSGIMEVDYVRVYDAAAPQVVINGKARVFENSTTTYSIPPAANQNFTWSVPAGATITGGQGTNQITVDWGTSSGGDVRIDIDHLAGAPCPGSSFFYTQAVEVYQNNCDFTFQDFESNTTMVTGFMAGQLYEVNNPGANGVNSSTRVGQYVRNGSEQYDALFYDDALLDNGADYTGGVYEIKMDVYTNAPIGTSIDLQIGNEAAWGGYPAGIHSTYTATTTTQNQWETITFTLTGTPDAPNHLAYANNLDRMVFLFNANSYTNHNYYFDNIRRELATPAPTITITGNQSVADSETGVGYKATGGNPVSNYLWNSPIGSTIANGQGTDTITIDYGSLGGNVSVQEQQTAGCWGPLSTLAVSVGGNCALFADEYDDGNTSGWVTNVGAAGFTHAEAISHWQITSLGHDEWAYIEYDINDGAATTTLDFTDPANNPILKFRARATDTMFIRVSLVDINGAVAQNTFLNPINGFALTTQYQEFTIDFNGQLWDEWGGGGALDESQIDIIRISLNPAFASFPETNPYGGQFTASFTGDVFIDYIRIGDDCGIVNANFTADDNILCATGDNVTFLDNSIGTDGSTVYDWDFGADATPATSTSSGDQTVSYSTPGWKTITLDLDNGTSVRTRTDYVYVHPTNSGCLYADHFSDNTIAPFKNVAGNFTFSESGSDWTVSTTGHGEYEFFSMDINNGVTTAPIDFTCPGFQPVIEMRAKASDTLALRVSFSDQGDIEAQNNTLVNNQFELTTQYQTFSLDMTGLMQDDFNGGGALDISYIDEMIFRINSGFASFPWAGNNWGPYDATFIGDVDIDYIAIGNSSACSVLPVTWLSFEAESANGSAFLTWSVLEKNVSHYIIEHSIDGESFSAKEQINAHGGSGVLTRNYQTTTFFTPGITNYYRIKSVDKDGAISYSTVRSVNQQTGTVYLAPNNFSETFTIVTDTKTPTEVTITDLQGKVMYSGTYRANTPLGALWPKGFYIVNVNKQTTLKAIKR